MFVKTALWAAVLVATSSAPALAQFVTTLGDAFNGSGGVASDAAGNIYVGDFGTALNNADGTIVWKITPDGTRTVFATGLQGAAGNGFDNHGNLMQSNIAAGLVSKISPAGTVTTFSTGHAGPTGIAVDSNDNVFVANCGGGGSIRKVAPDGSSQTVFAAGAPLNCPNGLTIDEDDNLYVANFGNGLVIKVTPDGVMTPIANISGNGNAHLTYLNGALYVVARNRGQVYRVTLGSQVTLIAGTGARGNLDGPALQSTFSVPNGITIDPTGTKIYVTSAVPLSGPALNPVLLRVITLDLPTPVVGQTFGEVKARYR